MKGHRSLSLLAALLAALLLASCSTSSTPGALAKLFHPEPAAEQPPTADTPAGVVQLLQWCYEHEDTTTYKTLFTCDFVFAFSATDSAGSPYRSTPWTREDELISGGHLFIGGAAPVPPASGITLTFSPDPPVAERDFRPGKTYPWHQRLDVQITLSVNKPDGTGFQVGGRAVFYVVRGDSACVPPEVIAMGVHADSTRWFIERWEDQTHTGPEALAMRPGGADQAGRAEALPARSCSWGAIKVLYR